MKILMSIKPKYVAKIMSGEKKFEFRKKAWRIKKPWRMTCDDYTTVIVYSSNPVKKIVGEFDTPFLLYFFSPRGKEEMWETVQKEAGITREEFDKYFANSKNGYAIRIGKIHLYDRPYTLQEKYPHLKRPPQSFCYVED